MRNFTTSTYQVALFRSVIPGDVPWSPPMSGVGDPNGRVKAVPGQLYTQSNGQLWCKGTIDPKMGWFRVAGNLGHPAVIVGNYYQTNPNGVVVCPGPAVWYGWDKSIWVKTDSANDAENWHLLLEYSMSVGLPTYYSNINYSDETMEAP